MNPRPRRSEPIGRVALAAALFDQPLGWSTAPRSLASQFVRIIVPNHGFHVFHVQGAATTVAAQ
jgi:hypothetical protein